MGTLCQSSVSFQVVFTTGFAAASPFTTLKIAQWTENDLIAKGC